MKIFKRSHILGSFHLVLLGLFLSSCTTKPCHIEKQNISKTTWVYEYDQSIQCELKSGTSLESSRKKLSSISVLREKKDHDKIARAQVCGALTGRINSFEISAQDLEKAMNLGFQQFDLKLR